MELLFILAMETLSQLGICNKKNCGTILKMARAKTNSKKTVKAKVVAKQNFFAKFRDLFIKIDRKTIIWAIVLIALFNLLYFGRSLFVAAVVNNQPIWRLSLISELEKQGGATIIENLIDKKLVDQEAKNQGISVTQEELDSEIVAIDEAMKSQGLSLDQALMIRGQSKNDLIEQIRFQKTVEKLFKDKIQVTEQEISDYYKENIELFDKTMKFEDLKEEIRLQVFQQKLSSEYSTWLQTLRDDENIIYWVNF